MSTLAIIGGGSWGTALGCVLAQRFENVRLWIRESDVAARTAAARVNDVFLPGFLLPDNVQAGCSLREALCGADILLSVMPSHVVRFVYQSMQRWISPRMRIVSATKGLEAHSLLRMTEVIRSVTGPDFRIGAISGPSFAREVAAGNPTALVFASVDDDLVNEIQTGFSGPSLRIYASRDIAGVEMGGALKNVIAIGAGMSDGLGLGDNARAALITRGLAEIMRLAVAAGAQRETLAGLAGLGDLVLTCTGDLSRNRQIGLKLAAGLDLESIMESTPMVAEGVRTTSVAMELAERYKVEMPIASEVHAVLNLGRTPASAIQRLMSRTLRSEAG